MPDVRPAKGDVDVEEPKKSNPSNESPGLDDFGGPELLGGTEAVIGPTVAVRVAGTISSPKRSTFCGARLMLEGWLDVAADRVEEGLNFCFSCTRLSG